MMSTSSHPSARPRVDILFRKDGEEELQTGGRGDQSKVIVGQSKVIQDQPGSKGKAAELSCLGLCGKRKRHGRVRYR